MCFVVVVVVVYFVGCGFNTYFLRTSQAWAGDSEVAKAWALLIGAPPPKRQTGNEHVLTIARTQ